jgi:hypothetical protein
MYLNEWIFGSFLCKLYMVSTSITQFSSSIFLLIMSADRFIAVCHPISSPRFRTQLVSKIVSLLAWGISALIMLPVMLYGKCIYSHTYTWLLVMELSLMLFEKLLRIEWHRDECGISAFFVIIKKFTQI